MPADGRWDFNLVSEGLNGLGCNPFVLQLGKTDRKCVFVRYSFNIMLAYINPYHTNMENRVNS